MARMCPRCMERPAGLGTSRLDGGIRLCTECENAEAMEDMFGEIRPIALWAIPIPARNDDEEEA